MNVKPTHSIAIGKFRYNLPDSFIAKYPLTNRDQSKLLHYHQGKINSQFFKDLPDLLPKESWLVYNNTRVIQARLQFRKSSGARIEIFCLEPVDPADYQQSFQSKKYCTWNCLVGNAKKWKEGPVSFTTVINERIVLVEASITEKANENFTIRFQWDNPHFSFAEIIEVAGSTPIPPYLNRDAEESDRDRYQTIYSSDLGSVAAPTAGLHFTNELFQRIKNRGIHLEEITLHVGAGTFVPVKESDARNHSMHAEHVVVPCIFLEKLIQHSDGVIAVGTTSTRSLESLYWLGVKIVTGEEPDPAQLKIQQWENEKLSGLITLEDSIKALMDYCRRHELESLHFSTQLMIVPGYVFKTINGLITNFHLPASTLLLLIAAFIGDDWEKVYDFALAHCYRFLSYGDSSLLLP